MYTLLPDLYILFSISIVYTYIHCINRMVPAFVFLFWGLGTDEVVCSYVTQNAAMGLEKTTSCLQDVQKWMSSSKLKLKSDKTKIIFWPLSR